ncbi:hypothetical protein CIHG_06091 [Coccidioides immitis H538.4]|uniref:Uncharacterized protein n=1 Tax=Coccidioides immitis H538.4 TaxID=396776 RepID=A0A0J8UL87_COCIT|nr:hypothetical protein CIHG_06091 [Coccidioides immitis H538.4]
MRDWDVRASCLGLALQQWRCKSVEVVVVVVVVVVVDLVKRVITCSRISSENSPREARSARADAETGCEGIDVGERSLKSGVVRGWKKSGRQVGDREMDMAGRRLLPGTKLCFASSDHPRDSTRAVRESYTRALRT